MNILFVLDYFTPHIGGAEVLFDNLTRRLADRGFGVSILTQRLHGTKKFEDDGRKIYRVFSPARYTFPLATLAGAHAAASSDIIHAATLAGIGSSRLLIRAAKKPAVTTFFEFWSELFFELQPPWLALPNCLFEAANLALSRNDAVIAISEYTKRQLARSSLRPRDVQVIYPGVDTKLYNPRIEPAFEFDDPTLLFFGRPGLSKGLLYLLQAMPAVISQVPKARLALMTANGRDYLRIAAMIRKLGLEQHITMIKPVAHREVAGVIKSADAVVVPSISEGFGFSAAESMACGKCVIASNAGSLPELIEHKKTGILVRPKSAESIASAAVEILRNRGLRNRLGRNAHRSARRFDWSKTVEAHIRIYEKLGK